MDNLTHSLTGALIGQAGLKRRTGLAMPALIIGANLPDVDAACFFWLDGVEHLAFRRGITHGPPAWVLLPLLLATILWGWDRWQTSLGKRPEARLPVHFGWLYALGVIGCLTHPALDWLNVYGIRLLAPFSQTWFYGDVLFIIDIWLWALLGLGLLLSRRREMSGGDWRGAARGALALAGVYVGLNWAITTESERYEVLGGTYRETIASPAPIVFWRRELIFLFDDANPQRLGRWSGPSAERRRTETLGNRALIACDLVAARRESAQVDAFLTWSRAPVLDRLDDGTWMLSDARYYGVRDGQFSVTLPDGLCSEAGAG